MQSLDLTELDFFIGQAESLKVYLELRPQLVAQSPGCAIAVQKTTISLRAPRPFVYVSFLPKSRAKGHSLLLLSFSSPVPLTHPLVMDSVLIRQGRYTVHAHVPISGQIDAALLSHIRASLHFQNPDRKKDNT